MCRHRHTHTQRINKLHFSHMMQAMQTRAITEMTAILTRGKTRMDTERTERNRKGEKEGKKRILIGKNEPCATCSFMQLHVTAQLYAFHTRT